MAMRVQCEVCGVEPAAVLCCAEEAALCRACNCRVHRANKIAAKHRRLALIHPSSTSSGTATAPLCEERTGLLFCVEDRAILCGDCDVPMHSAKQLTDNDKHIRFLLTGAQLSADPDDRLDLDASHGSSISDYLTNVCPGWHIDDIFLDDAAFAAAKHTGPQEGQEQQLPFQDISTRGTTSRATATSSSCLISPRRPPRHPRSGPCEPPSTTAHLSRRRRSNISG